MFKVNQIRCKNFLKSVFAVKSSMIQKFNKIMHMHAKKYHVSHRLGLLLLQSKYTTTRGKLFEDNEVLNEV